ncbi:hypothetical protein GQ44DRAFT_610840 [Phaeosphaeriaceae sp. PMI808]|nr:hypothetical protein GQ44DRAFT_610840 [Phaeosphaeriaceae sp. PMI808]
MEIADISNVAKSYTSPLPPVSDSSIAKQAGLTDATSMTEESEVQKDLLQQKVKQIASLDIDTRPRRNRERVSYIEVIPHDFSDDGPEFENRWDSDDSDVYFTPLEESEADETSASGDLDASVPVNLDSVIGEESEIDVIVDDNSIAQKPLHSTKKSHAKAKIGKGIDFNLPPLDNIEDIFKDMAAKAAKLGLSKVVQNLHTHCINVATMCSGTESPLLALELLSRALEEAGLPSITIRHHFSAEIEAFKQGFIERNYSPTMIFRDVRDFIREGATTATTAYGAEEPIPAGLDILVAGFVCKDLSRLNSKRKGLEDDGESGDTWRAIYMYAKRFRPSIVLLENVKGLSTVWEKVVAMWDKIGYEATWLICDTKRYYLPQTRERMYMIAIERSHYGQNVKEAATKWQELMEKMQRQCSSPYEAFLKNTLYQLSNHSALIMEPDWALCKLRYDHIRSEERLGILRPVTKWSENGTVRPPSFANRDWYHSQSSRVYDAIDVAHLQAAQKGYDSLYKMAVWDVSQNVDRFKAELGILPCITPNGVNFASNQQEALSGSHLLLLQGMPLNKLLFTTETQRDRQDLAGNAMSTTVIGASLISAIISGWQAFRPGSSPQVQALPCSNFVRVNPMTELQPHLDTDEQPLNLTEFKKDATMSSRLCNCERDKCSSKVSIHVCHSCGHTACTNCAGNPSHNYSNIIPRTNRTENPHSFTQKWRARLPTRVKISTFPDIRQLASDFKSFDQHMAAFIDYQLEISVGLQHFWIGDMLRQDNAWKVVYNSNQAKLELRIGHVIEWFLFMNCSPELPGNSPIRKLFEGPIARAKVADSLLDLQWKVYLPAVNNYTLQVTGSSSRCSSWRSRLGLPDYKTETVPTSLNVKTQANECADLMGEFELLSQCGTASNSLYKCLSSNLYLLLDPNYIGKSDEDCFVFSRDCSRKQFGNARISLAHMEASWRPWHMKDERVHNVEATISGVWLSAAMRLESASIPLTVRVPTCSESFKKVRHDCLHPITMLDASLQGSLGVEDLKDYSGALQYTNRLLSFSSWQSFCDGPSLNCSCVPKYPRIQWHINERGVATPTEDRKAAASFERIIKTRPSIFQIQATKHKTTTQIRIALNISALIHRARGRLPDADRILTTWRLATDHADLPGEPFPKFRLLSNSNDPSCTLSPAISYLRGTQPRSLSWMKAQELGREITITEVEEAIDARLGWRAEARAQTTISVRGGVLADLPSFGKTVATIALIQSEYENQSQEALLQGNRELGTGLPILLNTAATLVVCPPHIALQWQTEFKKFLGVAQFKAYNLILVESFDQLQKLTINDFQNCKVAIVSWAAFAEDEYMAHLAYFTAMPEASLTGRRAIDAWIRQALDEVPDQLNVLQNSPFRDFLNATEDLLEERLQDEDFQGTVPIRVQHGSAYRSFETMQNASKASKSKVRNKPEAKRKGSGPGARSHQVPLLHLFRFNRVVIDEYHYLNDDKKLSNVLASISVKRIAAIKRWVLSGTPELGNFCDVDRIASYLGIRLGRYHFSDGVVAMQSDKAQRSEQTLVEDFLSRTEIMSRQWHQGRHKRAQEFLNLFVRQNEACLGHITCAENLVPIELDIGHHAVYLELSQHFIAQRMQIRKLNKKSSSDKVERFNLSLDNSVTAEDALLKSALFFETSSPTSGLDLLSEKRSKQCQSTKRYLMTLMTGLEGLQKDDNISKLYNCFKDDIKKANWLGDEGITRDVRKMLIKAEKSPNRSGFPELKGTTSKENRVGLVKKLLSDLRETSRELALRVRSERFISTIRGLTELLSKNVQEQTFRCSSLECKGAAGLSQLYLASHCGHTACDDCLSERLDSDICVHSGCTLAVQSLNLIKVTSLGTNIEEITGHRFGRKIQAITGLVLGISAGEQGLVFAPNDETIEILENVFDYYEIPYHSLRGYRASMCAKIIEEFKTENDPDEQSKILILNLGSESAAGVNLINANHIIFVAPLLAKTQYDYDSAMAQAIARSRRYGQIRKVHIYHVVAQRTIDADILEHRHKRADGLTTTQCSMKMPKALLKKEKTKLVRNNAGEMALLPVSWVNDESKRRKLDVEEMCESFTSLINFSETFQHDDE